MKENMATYVIGHVTVKNPGKWAEYRSKVPATLAPWGAEPVFLRPSGSAFRQKRKENQMPDVNDLIGVVLNVKDMVSYQTGAVVSRTVIDKSAGTVTAFAFDTGQGLSEHTAPFDALVQILDGAADITISGAVHTVGEGEMIIMPAGKPHALKANSQFKMLLTMIKK